MKKPLLTFLLALACAFTVQAQQVVERNFDLPNDKKLVLELPFADSIVITGWNKPTVAFKAVVQGKDGTEASVHQLDFKDGAQKLTITGSIETKKNCVSLNIQYQIMVPQEVALQLNSISGNIEMRQVQGTLEVKSISGFIDYAWPGHQANIKVKSVTGQLYSNLNANWHDKGPKFAPVGTKMAGTLKGGGPALSFETISSNIYLRKE